MTEDRGLRTDRPVLTYLHAIPRHATPCHGMNQSLAVQSPAVGHLRISGPSSDLRRLRRPASRTALARGLAHAHAHQHHHAITEAPPLLPLNPLPTPVLPSLPWLASRFVPVGASQESPRVRPPAAISQICPSVRPSIYHTSVKVSVIIGLVRSRPCATLGAAAFHTCLRRARYATAALRCAVLALQRTAARLECRRVPSSPPSPRRDATRVRVYARMACSRGAVLCCAVLCATPQCVPSVVVSRVLRAVCGAVGPPLRRRAARARTSFQSR